MQRQRCLPQPLDALWLFAGQAPIADGSVVEIRGMRYRLFERAFEARVICDSARHVLYGPAPDTAYYALPWSEMVVTGHVTHIELSGGDTRFRLRAYVN